MSDKPAGPLRIRDDPGVTLDCMIVFLVRWGFKVKLNISPMIIVEPYSDGNNGGYGRGLCIVKIEGDEITVSGEGRNPNGSIKNGVFVTIPLGQPDAFEILASKIWDNLTQR
jgi:hypothetical protein